MERVLIRVIEAFTTFRQTVAEHYSTVQSISAEISYAPIVGKAMLKQQLINFALHMSYPSSVILEIFSLLSSEDEESSLFVVTALLPQPIKASHLSRSPNEARGLYNELWKAIALHNWDQLTAECLKLIHLILRQWPDLLNDEDRDEVNHRWSQMMELVVTQKTEPLKETALQVLGPLTAHRGNVDTAILELFAELMDKVTEAVDEDMACTHCMSYFH